jgi:hypothetical protein
MTRFNRHCSVALAAAALAVTVTACNPPADKAKSDAKTEESAKDSVRRSPACRPRRTRSAT